MGRAGAPRLAQALAVTSADYLADLIVRLKGLANYYIILILHINMPKWLFIDPYFCNFNKTLFC